MRHSRSIVLVLFILAAVGLVACGGPSSPSSATTDVVLHGMIMGGSAGGGAAAFSGTAGGEPIIVTVQGTSTFAEVKPNQEITVTIEVTPSGVSVVEERRTGIGHGDTEIEGLVQQVLELDPVGDSRFLIDGKEV